MPDPTAVYRLYAADGSLLYVGISNQPEIRWQQHALEKRWWPEVAAKDTFWYDDRDTAAAEEMRAIVSEDPRHNKRGPRRAFHALTLRLTGAERELLRREAFERDIPMSEIINEALDEFFARCDEARQ